MKSYWTQPSLSRDFALLSAAIVFLLLLISAWVTYATYNAYSLRIASDLEKESQRVNFTLETEMANAHYILSAMGKQIIINNERDPVKLAQVIKSFDSDDHIYTLLSWISPQQKIIISSGTGVLDKPVDVSDRDYVRHSATEPWKMYVGNPVSGRVSGRFVIPVAMGFTDHTGKLIGILSISVDVKTLSKRLKSQIHRDGISLAVVDKSFTPILQISPDNSFATEAFPLEEVAHTDLGVNDHGLIMRGNLFLSSGNYFYYRRLQDFSYTVLLGYDLRYSDEVVRGILLSRLLQLLVIAAFFVLFLWIMRARMIKPVIDMTSAVGQVAQGQPYRMEMTQGPEEIRDLSDQFRHVSEYIEESKRIEDELRNKVFMLKGAKESTEIATRSKSEFLAYACQEVRSSLNHIIGFAQTMRDQLHGPIENRKYRQYAADIYALSNTLLGYTQDLLTLAKIETGYTTLNERPVDIQELINKTLRFLADKMHAEKRTVKSRVQEPLPKLIADEFRLQQMLSNLLLYFFQRADAEQSLLLEARSIGENKDRTFFVLTVSTQDRAQMSSGELSQWAEQIYMHDGHPHTQASDQPPSPADINLELVKSLIHQHQGLFGIKEDVKHLTVALFFPGTRLHNA